MAKKKFADDYEIVSSIDEEGREKKAVVYRGNYFEFSIDEKSLIIFKRKCQLLLVVMVICHVGGGFVDNQGMYQFYIALPYVMAFFPLLYLSYGILRLPKEKRKYRRDEIGLSYDRMKTANRWLIAFISVGLLGEIIFLLFISAGVQNWREYIYLALEALVAGAVCYLIRMQKDIHVQVCSES